ncbi:MULTISPECIES: YraN family protein [unclassified Cupriavidus]|uniref:YraN family protein n=1 Tax=unclassified Cupriavidus TaxID=2640874 RepID=UPI00041B0211|nr:MULTISPECIES: YraN family protein [unclassified Cupriavidus]MBP0631941.1 YraN family protein [Cupriavidus sp. AcVe19-1a]MBP0635973.1 YraN family protein [Cupriavidus sp. AcVe19-6a]
MPSFKSTTQPSDAQARGMRAEDRALAHLRRQGLQPVVRNYRCKGGEIDLVMRAPDGTLVFVEVRQRSGRGFGGAAASVTPAKQRRVLLAAAHYLATLAQLPPCRFDVVALEPGRLEWLQHAFDLDAAAAGS